MSNLPLRFASLSLFVFALVVSPTWAAAEICFTATIDGIQSGTGSPATGTATLILNDAETELTYNIEFSGLLASESAAHIHSDGEGGGVVHPLVLGTPKIGVWKSTDASPLTPQRVQDLKDGLLYVNIHSTLHPAGEIRGQILFGPCTETCFSATVDGIQSGTGSPATGTGLFSLNHTQTELTYNISFTGLLAAESAAHLHSDAEGGGVVHPLVLGTPKVGVWRNTDASPLTPQRVQDLLNGQLYVNVHSTLHPAGEIRGQVLSGACNATCFTASVDGIQSGTGSPALGDASAILNHTETRLTVHVTYSGLLAAESAAHIHSDAEGGGVVQPLPVGTTKIASWKFTDPSPLTPQRVADLKSNQHYVNIHSTLHPAGEIRGQFIQGPCNPTAIGPIPQATASLTQNYPNPFNPNTTIRYALTEPGRVRLRIYDVQGRLVRTLVDEIGSPGPGQTVVWDGTNDSGQAVSSGIYFYRLTTTGFTATKKMVLLK
ncbi:MAG: CHRD domain-containing protein [Candidatus Krumholzibacteria bacterium]